MGYYLSKSRYCSGVQCPKMLWLKENVPDAWDKGCLNQAVLDSGLEVGDLAMGLFGDFVEVPYDKPGEMIKTTTVLMEQMVPIIAEASFSVNGCFCSVDILKRISENEIAVYEVKSSTGVSEIYLQDAAFQYYVLQELGYEVTSFNIVHINNKYIRHGELDIHELFTIVDVTQEAVEMQPEIRANIQHIREIMDQDTEPDRDIGPHCFAPYDCGCWDYCARHLPKPNVFDVRGMVKSTAFKCYGEGIVSFEDLLTGHKKLTARQRMQIEHELYGTAPYIDIKNIREYISSFTYPIYFFDFESYQPPIPPFDDIGPYKQVVFQYSLDHIAYEGAPIQHRDFLAEPGGDPRRALAEQLCRDIPRDVCIVTYNKSFEQTRIKELAELYGDLRDHLLNLRDHIVDLEVPFAKKWYYCKAMVGRSSIKAVLPALFPDDPTLNYANLEGVHQGGEASAAFQAMARMTPEESEVTRQQLLKYCGLDTYAMIKIWEKLKEICE